MEDRGAGDASLRGSLLRPPASARASASLSDSSDSEDEALSPGVPLTLQAEAVEEEEAVDSGPDDPPDAPRIPVRPFHLRGTSPTFSLRSHSIFGGLEGAAGLAGISVADPPQDGRRDDGPFKRPLPPPGPAPPRPPSRPQLPDYVTHPERWTKYSLEDVPDASDCTNRAVALEFLGDLKRRAGGQSPAPPESCAPSFNQDPSSRGAGRIVFTKPAKAAEGRADKKRAPWRAEQPRDPREQGDELVALGHLGSAGGPEGEGEEPPTGQAEPQVLDMPEEAEAEAVAAHPNPSVAGPVGFHGSRKRCREHLRPKGAPEEESEEA